MSGLCRLTWVFGYSETPFGSLRSAVSIACLQSIVCLRRNTMGPVPTPPGGGKKETVRVIDPIFFIGDDVTVVGGRWSGLQGMVVQVTPAHVVLVDNAAFRHWVDGADVVHTIGSYWQRLSVFVKCGGPLTASLGGCSERSIT